MVRGSCVFLDFGLKRWGRSRLGGSSPTIESRVCGVGSIEYWLYRGYIGGYIRIMEKEMEATI